MASTTPAAHSRDSTRTRNGCTLEIWDSGCSLGNAHRPFSPSPTPRVSMSNAFLLLEAFHWEGSRSPVVSLASLAQTTWPAFSVMCIWIPYCLYIQQCISDGWLPKAFSSHMLRLLKAAQEKNEKVLIRSVTVLCCLIGWSPVEQSTIKKNLSYLSCLHPIKSPPPPREEASNTLSSLSPEWRTFLTLLENFFHGTIGLTGLDFHFSPFLF